MSQGKPGRSSCSGTKEKIKAAMWERVKALTAQTDSAAAEGGF
jgi:hypothetical protein